MTRWCWLVGLVLACKDDSSTSEAVQPPPAKVPPSVPRDAAPLAKPAEPPDAAASDPRCGDACLFLTTTAVDELPPMYQKACGKPLERSDARGVIENGCDYLDYWRTCIEAAHGRAVKKKQWKDLEKAPWFHARRDYKPADLSALEAANLKELRARETSCTHGIDIGTADRQRVEAFLAEARSGRAALPEVVFVEGDRSTPAVLREVLNKESLEPVKIEYEEGYANVGKVDAAIQSALPGKRLQLIELAMDEPASCECVPSALRIFYDEAHHLVALHYMKSR